MKKKFLIVFSFFFLSISFVLGSSLKKAFEALDLHDYFKAKVIFSKHLKKSPCAASYGLGKLYLQEQNYFHNLDSAYKYSRKAHAGWQLLSEKQKLKLLKYDLDSLSIENLNFDLGKKVFENITTPDSLAHFKNFIDLFSFHPLLEQALVKRNELEFARSKKTDSVEAYKEFIASYPEAIQIPEAKALLDHAIFKQETLNKTEEEFASFIHNYPDSPYINEIYAELYKRYAQFDQTEIYLSFIKKYPRSSEVIKAWKNILELQLYTFSLQSLLGFEKKYPSQPLRNTVNSYREFMKNPLFPVRKNEFWGYSNAQGEIVIPFKYKSAGFYSEGIALVESDKGWILINHRGNPISALIVDDAWEMKMGIAIIEIDEKYGLIDRRGKFITKIEFEEIGEYSNELFSVMKNDKYGFINNQGKIIIALEYDLASDFSEGVAIVMKDGKYGAINSEGMEIIPMAFDWAEKFENGIARVKNESLYGFYNLQGQAIVPPSYEVLTKPGNNRMLVARDGKYGYMNLKGELITPLNFNNYIGYQKNSTFSDNVAIVKIKDKFGLIDTAGKVILEPKYEELKDIGGGFVASKNKNKWEYITYVKEKTLKVQFDQTSPFINNMAIVMNEDLYGLIDTVGAYLIEPEHLALEVINGVPGHFKVKVGDKWGIIKSDGVFPVEPRYDKIVENGIIKLFKEGSIYYYDWKTEKLLVNP